MYRDFYTTLAQVLPVLILALMFDSGYLQRLRGQERRRRRDDPAGVPFWTKGRVRAYVLVVVTVAVVSTGVALLVLAGAMKDSAAIRWGLVAGSALVLGTLLTRVAIDVHQATASTPAAAPAHSPITLPTPVSLAPPTPSPIAPPAPPLDGRAGS